MAWDYDEADADLPSAGYPELDGVQTTRLYTADAVDGQYSHHPHIMAHDGTLYSHWSNGVSGEDLDGQNVLWSRSTDDGETWTQWAELFPPIDERDTDGVRDPDNQKLSSNGFAVVGGDLYGIAEAFGDKATGGFGRLARELHDDGSMGPIFWLVDDPEPAKPGFPTYPNAGDVGYNNLASDINDYLDDPYHYPAWEFRDQETRSVFNDLGRRNAEPTYAFDQPGGRLTRFWRETGNDPVLNSSVSLDGGNTWSVPTRTSIPDKGSKSVIGEIPDGRLYLVGNQVSPTAGNFLRDPLTFSLSDDRLKFSDVYAIRSGSPALDFVGLNKTPGFQYPSTTVSNGKVFVIYSVGREHIEVSSFPVSALAAKGTLSDDSFNYVPDGELPDGWSASGDGSVGVVRSDAIATEGLLQFLNSTTTGSSTAVRAFQNDQESVSVSFRLRLSELTTFNASLVESGVARVDLEGDGDVVTISDGTESRTLTMSSGWNDFHLRLDVQKRRLDVSLNQQSAHIPLTSSSFDVGSLVLTASGDGFAEVDDVLIEKIHLIDESFDNGVVGATPRGWQTSAAKRSFLDDSNQSAQVSADPTGTGLALLLFDATSQSPAQADAHIRTSANVLRISFKYQEGASNAGDLRFALMDGGSDALRLFRQGQTLFYRDANGGAVPLGPITTGQWYRVVITVDRTSNTFRLKLDGQLVAQDKPLSGQTAEFRHLHFETSKSGQGTTWIDDVSIGTLFG